MGAPDASYCPPGRAVIDPATSKIIREYGKQIYIQIFKNVEEMDLFLENFRLPNLN